MEITRNRVKKSICGIEFVLVLVLVFVFVFVFGIVFVLLSL